MNRFPRFLPIVPLMAALCHTAADARPAIPVSHPTPDHRIHLDSRKFIPISEIKPGMRGYALTVFKGTKIEKFHVEILGVMAKFNQGKNYIMFRVLDGPAITRHLNIAEGMSGSPIYINGRLAGAISEGYEFAKDPIAFATPIADMLDAWSPDLPSKVSSISATAAPADGETPAGMAAPGMGFGQIDLPVSVSGFPARSLARLQTALAPFHFQVMAGAGGGEDTQNPLAKGASLQPGSAVGVSLVQGDMDMSAIGTLTYRDGNRVLLFGHPFTNFGPIDAALTTAYIVDVFPSYQNSTKLGSPIKTVGRIFQDRPFSVGGLIGSMPHMIPMTVDINDLSIKRHKTFHMQVINHPLLTGQLVTQLAGAAIAQVHGQPGDTEATVTMDADVEQIGHVHRTNVFYDATSIDQSATSDLDSLMRLLSSNPFYPLQLKSLKMAVTIQNRHDTAEVDHIFLKQTKYAPGDTINVGVVLKPYKRDPITRYISIKIPDGTPNSTLTLSIKGGGSDSGGGISLGGGIILLRPQEPLAPAGNVGQLVKELVEKPRNDALVARLILPTSAININGDKLTTLPPTLAGVMQAARTSGLQTERDEVKVTQPTPYIVSGTQSLTVSVLRKPVGDTTSVTSTTTTSTSPTGTTTSTTTSTATTTDSLDDSDDAAKVSFTGSSTENLAVAPSVPPVRTPASPANGTIVAPTAPPLPNTTVTVTTSAPPVKPDAIKTVGRLASIWRQGTTADFTAGTLQNVSVTSNGDVRLSASLKKVAETGESYLWSLVPDGQGQVFAGTGDHGYVYKIGSTGKPTLFFKTGQLEVTALARDGQGNLYAGTAPNGIVYKIGPDGKGKPFFTAKEKYVTALAYDATRSRLYVATGGGTGRVYAVPATGSTSAEPWFTSPETHLLSLALGADGSVYAGSSPNGIVYKIATNGVGQVLYDAPEQSIASLAVDSHDNVYVGTTPKGTIYKITPDGSGKILSASATAGIFSLQTDKADDLYASAGNTIYRISPDETVQSFVAPTDEQFLSLAVDPTTGQVYTGTATVASLYEIGASGDLQGQFMSTVHDAGLTAHWGSISWTADTPPGTRVTLQTRSGNVERPDDSWSAWSPAYTMATGQKILSPPGRYLQYQATLTGNGASIAQGSVPKLRQVAVYFLPRNQAPTVKILSPSEGDAVSKATLIRWTGGDPDKDTLTFDLSYSADGGRTWTAIKKKAQPQQTAPPVATAVKPLPAATGPVTDQEVAAEVAKLQASLAGHPELPAAVRKQILAQAPAMARQALTLQHAQAAQAATGATAAASNLKELSYSWDSTEVPDGTYEIQVVASDKASNPNDPLTAKSVSPSFIVANTAPTLSLSAPSVAADKSATIHGSVSTGLAFVKAVQGKTDNGDPVTATADDGLFDSSQEAFTWSTSPLKTGTHVIEIQAIDQAGNTVTKSVTVQIP